MRVPAGRVQPYVDPFLATDWALVGKTFTSKELSWSVGANWPLIRFLFLATSVDNTGRIVSVGQMPADRTMTAGDTFKAIYRLYLQ